MKIKRIVALNEEGRTVGNVSYANETQDQFPYVEAALNSLDNNFNWWKDNWEALEHLIVQYLEKSLSKNMEASRGITISSRFTMFHGHDDKVKDVIWTGPAIVYTITGVPAKVIREVKKMFGGIYKGRKIFTEEDQLIFLFG